MGCTSTSTDETIRLTAITEQLKIDMEKYITQHGFPKKPFNPFTEGIFTNLPITCSSSGCSDQKRVYSGFCFATGCSLNIIPKGDFSRARYVINMSIGDIPHGRYRPQKPANSQPTDLRWKQLCLYKHIWNINICKNIGYPSDQMSLKRLQMLGVVR